MQCVTAVDGNWLAELGPMFYSVKDATKSRGVRCVINFHVLYIHRLKNTPYSYDHMLTNFYNIWHTVS